jgi:hypothetical protein
MPRVRFRLWSLMLAVAFAALVIAGFVLAFRDPVVVVERAPAPRWANIDHEIFDIVLTDLIENQEFDPAVGGRGIKKNQIVFGDTTSVGAGYQLVDAHYLKDVPLDLRHDLAARNPRRTRFSLAGYRPSNPDILVRDLRKVDQDFDFAADFPNARGYVESRLPGYSKDGQMVVVSFRFGPTAHGAIGYYLLKKVKGRWEIVRRDLGYFH